MAKSQLKKSARLRAIPGGKTESTDASGIDKILSGDVVETQEIEPWKEKGSSTP